MRSAVNSGLDHAKFLVWVLAGTERAREPRRLLPRDRVGRGWPLDLVRWNIEHDLDARHPLRQVGQAGLNLFKAPVHGFESLILAVESFIHAVKRGIDGGEAFRGVNAQLGQLPAQFGYGLRVQLYGLRVLLNGLRIQLREPLVACVEENHQRGHADKHPERVVEGAKDGFGACQKSPGLIGLALRVVHGVARCSGERLVEQPWSVEGGRLGRFRDGRQFADW